METGRFDEAEPHINEALVQCEELGLIAEKAYVLNTAGWPARERRQYVRAREIFGEVLTLSRQVDDKRGENHALAHLGWLAHLEGDNETAIGFYRQALPLQWSSPALMDADNGYSQGTQ